MQTSILNRFKKFEVKAFDSPSSITESDSDGKARLSDRSFNQSFKDMLISEMKTGKSAALSKAEDTASDSHLASDSASEEPLRAESSAFETTTDDVDKQD